MAVVPYNLTIHDNLGTKYLNSTSFSIWGTCWDAAGITSTDKSIVPMIRMNYGSSDRRRLTDNQALPTVPVSVQQSLSELRAIPLGRRCLFPNYLQDDGIGGGDLANSSVYKTNTNTNILVAGVQFDSPFQYNATASQSKDAGDYFKFYLNLVEKNNAFFNEIIDDFEAYGNWSPQGVRLTGGALQNWQTPGDARLIQAIVQDARFSNQTTHGDFVRGVSWANILEGAYLSLTGQSSTAASIMSPWFNRASATDYYQPWGVSANQMYSYEKALRQVQEVHRVERIFKPILSKPWFTGTYSNWDTLNNDYSEWKYLRDYNTHYGNLGGLIHPDEKVSCFPVLYGTIGQVSTFGFKANPVTDFDKYQLAPPGAGVTTYSSTPYLAFVMDMQTVRSTIRANIGRPLKAWVQNPNTSTSNSTYYLDERYWKEMIFHSALAGVNPFGYFQETQTNRPVTPLHNCLVEIRNVSKNGTFKACSNASGSTTTKSELIELKTANDVGIISGGYILSGALHGQKLWRVTVPPQIIGGTGATSVSIVTDGITETVTVPSTSRGFWCYSDTKPTILSITGI